MSLLRRDARRDANEAEIVEALERCGWVVTRISMEDWPDLHCGRGVTNWWLEVKMPGEEPTKGQREQHDRMSAWRMRVGIVHSIDEALRCTGDLR